MGYSVVKSSQYKTGYRADNREEFLIDSASDIANLPTEDIAPGSIAYTANGQTIAMLDNSHTWVLWE